MNHELVAEYLANAKSPVQLVKHLDEVTEKNIKYPLFGQHKHDGLYTLMVVCNGDFLFYSRTGKPFYYEYDTISTVFGELPEGAYVLELCNPKYTLEQLSGLVNTNRKKVWEDVDRELMHEGIELHFHDYLSLDELLGGHSEVLYLDRLQTLRLNLKTKELHSWVIPIEIMYSREDVDRYADDIIAKGGEGAVFKQDCDWVAGHKGYRAMKLVRGIHLDLKCVDVLMGKGKRAGLIAALVLQLGDNTFKADLGKGWNDTRRKALTLAHESGVGTTVFYDNTSGLGSHAGCTEYPPIGRIWEVKALQMSSTGKAMRLPKVTRLRDDKTEPDTI